MLFYQIGELFQSYAVGKSRRNISELMDIRPDYANIEVDGKLEPVSYTHLDVYKRQPNFWVGLLLMLAFCVYINAFPVISSAGDFKSLFLPALTLAIAMSSKYTRQVRTAVLDELSQDYVIGAQARGVKKSKIIWGNVFPNSLLPLITMFGLSIGSLLGGTSVVEVIFSYPGLGNLAVSAITSSDYNLIQGYVLWLALIYMVINLIVDASYVYIDPRMRLKE